MEKVGIFYGSTTGNCQIIAELIKNEIGDNNADVFDVIHTQSSRIVKYSNIIFGVSTWGISDLQEDWGEFLNSIEFKDLENKRIALYGLGDQITYDNSFVDAMGILYEKLKYSKCKFVGFWPAKGYSFKYSRALENGHFVGLVLDEDTQYSKSLKRIKQWTKQLKNEFI